MGRSYVLVGSDKAVGNSDRSYPGFNGLAGFCLTHSVFKVVLQKSTFPKIRQLIFYLA